MSRSAFVDTSGWYAMIDRNNAAHSRAAALVRQFLTDEVRLVTTDEHFRIAGFHPLLA